MSPVYELGPFRLDPAAGVLTHAGRPVGLGSRGVSVLSALVQRANEYVTKAGIMDAAWPGLVVEESNLSVQVSAIRRVLAQASGGEHWVETLARRGYRYVGPVAVLDDGLPHGAGTSHARSNLPGQLTSFVGRERELVELKRLLTGNRLLTLVGVGGIGKTRLALQVAAEVVDAYRDGVWFVDLAPLSDAAMVPGAVARGLRVRETAGTPLLETVLAYVKEHQLLLLLDNCEHLLDACAELADALLLGAAEVSIIATSREPLRVAGEQTYPLPTLSLPDSTASVATMKQSEAVQLFIERAAKQQPGFALTTARARAIAQLCIHLDGIPLALELAAARVRSLSIEEINARLGDRFKLLAGGTRTALPRQQTLRSSIDWSYDLLRETEKSLLCRLGVFSGGWMLEAAEQICSGEGIAERDVLDLLSSLADKNLVIAEERNGATRYRLLETVREYAREKLVESGNGAAVREQHRNFFLALAERAEPKMSLGAEQAEWLQRLDEEHENLRLALGYSIENAESQASLRLCGALKRFWFMRGHLSEGRQWCMRVLGETGGGEQTSERAKTLDAAGTLAYYQSDFAAGRALLEESLTMRRQLGDPTAIASALNNLGNVMIVQGDYHGAGMVHREALAIRQALGDRRGVAASLNNLGNLAADQLDLGSALALYNECLAIMRELGNRGGIASSLYNLGNVAYARDDYLVARALYEECLPIQRELGNKLGIADALQMLGDVAFEEGDYRSARTLYQEGLSIIRELGHRGRISTALAGLAAVVSRQGSLICAARIWGATERLREEVGSPLSPRDRPRYDRRVDAARAAAGDDVAFDRARQEGHALNLDQAITAALEGDSRT